MVFVQKKIETSFKKSDITDENSFACYQVFSWQ